MKVQHRNVVVSVSFLQIRQCVDVYLKAFLEHTALLAPRTWTTCFRFSPDSLWQEFSEAPQCITAVHGAVTHANAAFMTTVNSDDATSKLSTLGEKRKHGFQQ